MRTAHYFWGTVGILTCQTRAMPFQTAACRTVKSQDLLQPGPFASSWPCIGMCAGTIASNASLRREKWGKGKGRGGGVNERRWNGYKKYKA